jgi:hypothetical protein
MNKLRLALEHIIREFKELNQELESVQENNPNNNLEFDRDISVYENVIHKLSRIVTDYDNKTPIKNLLNLTQINISINKKSLSQTRINELSNKLDFYKKHLNNEFFKNNVLSKTEENDDHFILNLLGEFEAYSYDSNLKELTIKSYQNNNSIELEIKKILDLTFGKSSYKLEIHSLN